MKLPTRHAFRTAGTYLGCAAVLTIWAICDAQVPVKKRSTGDRMVTGRQILPMFQIAAQAKFPVRPLKSSLYNFMRAELVDLAPGFGGDPKTRRLAYLTYGAKRGGLVRIYETPTYRSRTAKQWIDLIRNERLVHDSFESPQFRSDGFSADGVAIIVTSLDPKLLAEAKGILQQQR